MQSLRTLPITTAAHQLLAFALLAQLAAVSAAPVWHLDHHSLEPCSDAESAHWTERGVVVSGERVTGSKDGCHICLSQRLLSNGAAVQAIELAQPAPSADVFVGAPGPSTSSVSSTEQARAPPLR